MKVSYSDDVTLEETVAKAKEVEVVDYTNAVDTSDVLSTELTKPIVEVLSVEYSYV